MLRPNKNSLFMLSAVIATSTLFSFTAIGGEPEGEDYLTPKKKTATIETVHVKVINQYGRVILTDFKTITDDHIDFDLAPLPVGNYAVEVHYGDKHINTTEMKNISSDPNVITAEILNAKGKQVYESSNGNYSYNLSSLPAGQYKLNIYQGEELINSQTIKN